MKPVYHKGCIRKAPAGDQAHVPGKIKGDFLNFVAFSGRKLRQEWNDRFRMSPFNNGNQRAFLPFGSLIGDNRVQFTVGQRCFINGKVWPQVLREYQTFSGIIAVFPLLELTQTIPVVALELLAGYTIE